MNEAVGTIYEEAEVIEVIDANYLRLLFNGTEERLCRLFGVESPEYVYAITTWPEAYEDLPEELQVQQFAQGAYNRFNLAIDESSPIGTYLTAEIKGKDEDDTLVVVLTNSADADIAEILLLNGYALTTSELTTSSTLYTKYTSARNSAQQEGHKIWSVSPVYTPEQYRKDVDDAARRILYMVLESSLPDHGYTLHYIDDPIVLEFSREPEATTLSVNSIFLYKIDIMSDGSEAYVQIYRDISKTEKRVTIVPTEYLSKNKDYLLLVIGGANGIKAIDEAQLEGNISINFKTTNVERPGETTSEISNIDIITGAYTGPDQDKEYNLFGTGTADKTMRMVSSVPADRAFGIHSLDKIHLIFNSVLLNSIPREMVDLRYSDLPVDQDPMGNRRIPVFNTSISDNVLSINIDPITQENAHNREYFLRVPSGAIYGKDREIPNSEIYIKFLGRLSPLYVLPHDVKMYMTSWNDKLRVNISDYELYKLILRHSVSTDILYGVPSTPEELMKRHQLVLCLILLDIVRGGSFFGGGIKSRHLLETRVEYYEGDREGIIGDLEDCIRDNSPSDSVQIGVKSGYYINRMNYGKTYGIYR